MSGPHPIPIPAGLSEADLLAWVEGGPLQRDVAAAVARALDSDPGLARLLGSMKGDRAAILALADERAPDGLVDAAMAIAEPALERRMLLGMESSAPARGGTPVSIVQPPRRSVLEVIFADRVGRRFAAAAGLLLVAGGATWFVTSTLTRGGLSRPPEVRIADAGTQERPPEVVAPPTALESEEPGIELAMGPPPPPLETEALKQASELRAAMAETVPATTAPMATARALDLARGRRLVIRVTGTSLEQGSARMQSLAVAHARPESAWRVSGEAPPRVAALFTPRPTQWPMDVPASDPAALASRSDPTGAALPPAAPVHVTPPPPPRCRVFTVESRLDESALDAILASLSGDGLSAAFAEATDAVPESAPGMTAAALLWWTQAPASWAPWGTIPVVILEK